ncbi:MAG: hypothetical protein ACRCYU_22555 [Nocardioides sp.]
MKKFFRRYWGYVLLGIGVFLWLDGRLSPSAGLFLAAVGLYYAALAAPTWCGAEIRIDGERCRNNSYGLLRGCNQVRQHKWQRAKSIVVPASWRDLNRGLWTSPQNTLATVSSVVSIAVGVSSLATAVFG